MVYLGSAASYAILSQATSPLWLYCSKIPTILQHAFLVGQATVSSESSASSSRAVALGRMTTAYTIGATIGPALGGYLGASNLYAGARLAVWGSLVSVALSVLYLKDHQAKKEKSDQPAKETPQNSTTFIQSIQRTLSYLNHPTIGPLLFIKLLNGVSSSAFSTILPLILANKLHFSTIQLGSFMSASSLSVAAFAAICIKPLMSFVGNQPDKLAFVGIGYRLLSIISFGLVVTHVMTAHEEEISNTWLIITTCSSVTISLSSHMHATSLTTLTTGVVSREERGAIIGLEHGLFSMARIVGPPLGTSLLSSGPSLFSTDADGLWRVIFTCVMMECVLMTCLKAWSSKQIKVAAEVELIGDDNKPLIEEKDHSD